MPDESDPPRKFYQLKPKEFDSVNAHPPQSPPAAGDPGTPDPGPSEINHGRIDVKDLFKHASTPGRALSRKERAEANEVHAVLAANHARANAAGLNEVSLRPRRASRRKRDYWLLLIPVNAFFAFVAFGPYRNPMTFIYGLAGMVLFSIGLTWAMWFVMDDY
jgi:hypothetical protein